MVHSGSRALGQVIRDHHLARAQPLEGRLRVLDAESDSGKEYLHDAFWARRFAAASRKAMAEETGNVLARTLRCSIRWETMIASDHNHVALERHAIWVAREYGYSWKHIGHVYGMSGISAMLRFRRRMKLLRDRLSGDR